MSNQVKYHELYAFHPGYYISEIIEDMGISHDEFATRMGTSGKTLSKLVNGQCNMSIDLAQKISAMLGSSADVWLDLQKVYNEKLIEIEQKKSVEEQIEIVKLIDYSYFVKVAHLPPTRDVKEKISSLCRYLMISDLKVLTRPDFLVNFRAGIASVQNKNIINAQAWLQTAMNLAKGKSQVVFNAYKLKGYLTEIREMTMQSPSVFIPRLKDIFTECGVAFILLPHLRNSGINGAVKWYGHNQVILAMNDRRCFADTFWFSLFHEIKHVLQQKVTMVFLSSDFGDISQINLDLENDADEFAQDILIPRKEYMQLAPSKYITDSEIVSFSKRINIHPGVLVGRLQHDGIIPQNRCAKLKERYRIIVT